jgi:hypothetical protein
VNITQMIDAAQRDVGDRLMTDLYTWCHDGWGFNTEHYDVGMCEQPHRELCETIESVLPMPGHKEGQQLLAIAEPRGTLKSVIGVNGLATYFTTKWKHHYGLDTRTIIGRSTREQANTNLTAIKETFERNQFIRPLVEAGVRDSKRWAANEILLSWRSRVMTDPTIMTTGLDVGKAGAHIDLIILDDLINETNFESPRALEYAWTLIQSFLPILETNGTMIVIGTFWSPFDHFQKILQQNEEFEARRKSPDEKPPWKTLIRGSHLEDGRLLWPEKLNEAFLEKMRRRTSPKLYACWYENKIVLDEHMVFKPQDIRYFDGEYDADLDAGEPPTLTVTDCGTSDFVGQQLRVRSYLLCDTAVTTTDRSNHTGLVFLLVDTENRWWIYDAIKLRETPSRVIDRIVGLCAQYEIETNSIETVAANELFALAVQEKLRENAIPTRVVRFMPQRLKSEGVSLGRKSTRIEWLEPKFRRGEVFVRRGLRGLNRELESYDGVTRQEHYDLLDALSQAIELAQAAKPYSFAKDAEDREIKWHDEYVKNAKKNRTLGGKDPVRIGNRFVIP